MNVIYKLKSSTLFITMVSNCQNLIFQRHVARLTSTGAATARATIPTSGATVAENAPAARTRTTAVCPARSTSSLAGAATASTSQPSATAAPTAPMAPTRKPVVSILGHLFFAHIQGHLHIFDYFANISKSEQCIIILLLFDERVLLLHQLSDGVQGAVTWCPKMSSVLCCLLSVLFASVAFNFLIASVVEWQERFFE
jgi:hypothetical protein